MKKLSKTFRMDLIICLLIVFLSYFVVKPFFQSGYFPTHDGEWAVVRLTDMYRQLKDLQLPPRYSGNLNFGYGYPLFNFAYPFPYYLGIVFYILGLGFVDSIKLIFAITVPLSAIGMYFLSGKIWKNKLSGLVSSLFYIYLPYRFVDLYVRGSIGESLSFVFFPLILLTIINIHRNSNSLLNTILLAITFACLILTHNIMTVLFLPIMLVIICQSLFDKNKKNFALSLSGLTIGLLLAAFFWLPALFEKQNILLSRTPIADRNLYYVNVVELLKFKWGYGTPTEADKFTYNLGLPHVISFLIVTVVAFISLTRKKINNSFKLSLILIILTLFNIILLFKFTDTFWKTTPLFSEINYPWTLLAPIGFLMSLLSGRLLVNTRWLIPSFILVFFAVLLYLPFAVPSSVINRDDDYYLTNDATTTSSSELMPLWVKNKPSKRYVNKVELPLGAGEINDLTFNSRYIKFKTKLNQDSQIRVNTIYYPGWKASADGANLEIKYNNPEGIMTVFAPKGTTEVHFYFTEPPIRLLANFLSLVGIIIIIIFPLLFRYLKSKLSITSSNI